MFSNRIFAHKVKKCFLTCIYCPIYQSSNHDFCVSNLPLSNTNNELPNCWNIAGDFNVPSSNWWKNDATNSAGHELDSSTSSAGYSQNIDKPTHIANNLIFCTDTNVICKHGVDVSIFDKFHHNIFFYKTDISSALLPVYIHKVWNYNKTNTENIKKGISNINWNKAFGNLSIDAKVGLLNKTLLNIFRNYIPKKKINCNYC